MSTPTDCCPGLDPCEPCDTLDITYRLPYRPVIDNQTVPVTATVRYRLSRCPGPLGTGPLVYTTTLLPGEKQKLLTTDRHTQFSYDTSSTLAYHHRAASEESFYTAGMARAMSSIDIVDTTRRNSSYHESAVSGGGGAGLDLGFFEIGGSVQGSSFDASSTERIVRNFSQHAQSSHFHTESGVRAASSVSVGSVSSRTHAEGSSDDHFESVSRTIENKNQCRALTFLFHQIVKCQTVTFELVAIDLDVDDASAPTGVTLTPPKPVTGLGVIPQQIRSDAPDLLATERAARQAAAEREQQDTLSTGALRRFASLAAVPPDVKDRAITAVMVELVQAGLLDEDGDVSDAAKLKYGWTRTLTLPTPGIQVRSCLDECDACEPELHRKIDLELDRMELENRLLERRIELMDRDKEHNPCCGDGFPPGS